MNKNVQTTEQNKKHRDAMLLVEHAALASMSDGVVVSDGEGRVLVLNRAAARMLKVDPDTVLGHPVSTLFERFSARGRMTVSQAMERLCADPYSYGQSGKPAETIIEIGTRFIQAHLAPVLTDVGEFWGIVTVLRDITREVEADRSRSDFVSNVSHELRLPLTAIKGYCDLLLHDAVQVLDQEHVRFLQIVQNNADHLVALINDLLDISRVESYRLDLDIRPVQLEQVVREVADTIKPQCDLKKLRLMVEIEPQVGMVLGDPNRLGQVIANLANYACNATPEGGRIKISLSSSEEGVQVSVSDTAARISAENRARIFQRFHRTEESLAHEVHGTGLELPVARILVEMHGGRLWVESETEGGNTFTFVLPRRVDVPSDISVEEEKPSETNTVLVVEDDEDIAQLIALQLRREGFEVLTTAYGEEAVSLVQTEPIDLITLDMMLPDITGMEVLHRIKADPATAEIPVIIVSVLLPEQTGDADREAIEHITKPFAFEKLMESIRRTLDVSKKKVAPVLAPQ
ncbi:MAG TPA: hybrid sensor histidine kinase/response regulator [Chloroflexi bacterium]|mgnify:CR=1 FL=1|nr:hybrid sensor histidine kinase/response regulator [Chloroflexota bacterium]